jgi:N-acetylglucosamine-6-phosphate deacetylase
MASLVPARISGCADRKGTLETGKDADVALLGPDFHCRATWVRGRQVFGPGSD